MKPDYARFRTALFFGFSFLFAHNAFADFSGQFAATNWTISTQAFGCGHLSVDTSGAPCIRDVEHRKRLRDDWRHSFTFRFGTFRRHRHILLRLCRRLSTVPRITRRHIS